MNTATSTLTARKGTTESRTATSTVKAEEGMKNPNSSTKELCGVEVATRKESICWDWREPPLHSTKTVKRLHISGSEIASLQRGSQKCP